MKTKIYFLILFAVTFGTINLNAQIPDWQWANGIGNIHDDMLSSVAVHGNSVYATGNFTDSADFDPGTGVYMLTSSGNEDIFISCMNTDGDLIWAKSIGGNGFDWGFSIKTDLMGNIYVAGFFSDTVDFDPGAGIYTLTSAGLNDIFVCKLDSAGNFIWAKSMGGTLSDMAQSIAVDDSGNVCIAGSYNGTADFNPDTSAAFNLTGNGELEMYVCKLDSSGNFQWANSFGGTEDDQAYAITLDASGNVYTTGYFEKTVDFDPDSGIYNLVAPGSLPDAFISKLNSNGDFVWAKSFTGITDNDGYSIVVDDVMNVYTTGYFNGTIDFDPDSVTTYNITSAGNYDGFISKLDSNGNFIWLKTIGGTDDDQSFFITLDDSSNILTSGIFRSTADFNPDDTATFNLTASGGFDTYVSKLDSAGNFIWVKGAGGNSRDQINSMALDNSGNIYAGGYFYSQSITLNLSAVTNSQSNGTTSDIFITKLGNTITGFSKIENNYISIYPNPVNSVLSIDISSFENIDVFDVNGRCVNDRFTVVNSGERVLLDVTSLSTGVYFVKVYLDENIFLGKFLRE